MKPTCTLPLLAASKHFQGPPHAPLGRTALCSLAPHYAQERERPNDANEKGKGVAVCVGHTKTKKEGKKGWMRKRTPPFSFLPTFLPSFPPSYYFYFFLLFLTFFHRSRIFIFNATAPPFKSNENSSIPSPCPCPCPCEADSVLLFLSFLPTNSLVSCTCTLLRKRLAVLTTTPRRT